jgi:hypothetical protein
MNGFHVTVGRCPWRGQPTARCKPDEGCPGSVPPAEAHPASPSRDAARPAKPADSARDHSARPGRPVRKCRPTSPPTSTPAQPAFTKPRKPLPSGRRYRYIRWAELMRLTFDCSVVAPDWASTMERIAAKKKHSTRTLRALGCLSSFAGQTCRGGFSRIPVLGLLLRSGRVRAP